VINHDYGIKSSVLSLSRLDEYINFMEGAIGHSKNNLESSEQVIEFRQMGCVGKNFVVTAVETFNSYFGTEVLLVANAEGGPAGYRREVGEAVGVDHCGRSNGAREAGL